MTMFRRFSAPPMDDPGMSRLGSHVPLDVLCRHAANRLQRGGLPIEGELFLIVAERLEQLTGELRRFRDLALAVNPLDDLADDVGDHD